jgi:hypothetical protein
MAAPVVASVIVTDWAAVKAPPAGKIDGVAATGLVKVKLAVAIELAVSPVAVAMALTVSVAETGIAAEYLLEDVVGAVPSVV